MGAYSQDYTDKLKEWSGNKDAAREEFWGASDRTKGKYYEGAAGDDQLSHVNRLADMLGYKRYDSLDDMKSRQGWESGSGGGGGGGGGSSYEDQLAALARANVQKSINSQISNINRNLDDILTNLAREKSTVEPIFTKSMENIKSNEFNTSETQKELMNQSGWNMNNSGLAVGEMGKIKIGADKSRGEAEQNKALALQDIATRESGARNNASRAATDIQNWGESELSSLLAQAAIEASNRATQQEQFNKQFDRGVLESDRNYGRSVFESDRSYDYDATRDQINDDQWMKKFNYEQQQNIIQQALEKKRISISESNAALSRAEFAYRKERDTKEDSKKASEETVGALYSSMMNAKDPVTGQQKDPAAWLKENAQYLTDSELKSLAGYLPKDNNTAALLEAILKR